MKTLSSVALASSGGDVFVLELLSKGKAVRFAVLTSALEHMLIPVRGRDDAQALWG
jgi:hypothetical protein